MSMEPSRLAPSSPRAAAGAPGQSLIAHKGYRSAAFECQLADVGITLIRPGTRTEPAHSTQRSLEPLRQIIESTFQTLKANSASNATAGAPPPASGYASCNASSPSPPLSGTTQQPGPAHSLLAYDH